MKKYLSGIVFVLVFILSACTQEDENNVSSQSCTAAPDIFIYEKTKGNAWIEIAIETDGSWFNAPPSYALWAEYPDGNIESVYATCKAAKNLWGNTEGQPESLPVWYGKRELEGLSPKDVGIDAITTATPVKQVFKIHYEPYPVLPGDTLDLFVEINLPYDYNDFYTENQGSNGQPSVVWRSSVVAEADTTGTIRNFRYIGHSHPKGEDSEIYFDRQGITTAISIFNKLTVTIL